MTQHNKLDRRDFLRLLGAGSLSLALNACIGKSSSSDSSNDSATTSLSSGKEASGSMTLRHNPNSGDEVSLLGYGCMRFPTVTTEGQNATGDLDQDAINRLIDHAMANGVNYYDTSPAYCKGFSERAVGIALKRHPRNKFFIATKLSNFSPNQWSREEGLTMYHKSLKELQVDYIDYMLLHGIGMGGVGSFNARYVNNGILDFLVEERRAGRIRNLGFSFHGDLQMYDYFMKMHDEGRIHWDFVQIQLNYIDWAHATDSNPNNVNADYLYAELEKRNIPAVIMEPLLGGRLAQVNNHLNGLMKQRRPDDSIASWAFRFAGTHKGVLTVLSGMTYMEHLKDNLHTYSPLQPCSADELAFLEEAAKEILHFPTVPCTDCKYCMPCPYGIDIPANFAHYNRCINEGILPDDTEASTYKKARQAYLVGYDRSVPKLRQASHCIGCNNCRPHCPQNINIPARMADIDAYVEQLKRNA